MLNTPAAVVPAIPGPLNPPSTQASASNGADDGRAFAQALDQAAARQRDAGGETAEPQQQTRKPAEPGDDATDTAHAAPPDAGTARPTTRALPAHKPAMVAAAVAASAAGAAPASGETAAAGPDVAMPQRTDSSAEAARADAADTAPQDLAAWVSSLPLPRPAAATATEAAAAPVTAAIALAGTAASEPSAAGAAGRPEPPASRATAKDGLPTAASLALPAGLASPRQAETRPGRGLPQTAAELAGTERPAPAGADAAAQAASGLREAAAAPRTGIDAAPATATLPVGWAGILPRSPDGAAPLQAELKPPVGSQEFAPALGSQLSVMVRNGVEHAQLKLNPAEMGPIEVRISLDGTQAQVDFSAANALTRQALQDAVPALASALRESGLTLSGGGVFEQSREQRGEAGQDGARQRRDTHGGAADQPAGAVPAVRTARSRGVVDLYA
jgi:flagellar hook-length control protein FliK